jgi:hypothetical protein
MVVSIALLPWVVFDFNPLHLRDPEAPSMQALTDLTRDPDRTPNVRSTCSRRTPGEAAGLAARLSALPEVGRRDRSTASYPRTSRQAGLDQDASGAARPDAQPVRHSPPAR